MYPSMRCSSDPYSADLPHFKFGIVLARVTVNDNFSNEIYIALVYDSHSQRMGWMYVKELMVWDPNSSASDLPNVVPC